MGRFLFEGVEQTANSAVQPLAGLWTRSMPIRSARRELGALPPNALCALAALRQRPILGIPQLCQHTGMTFTTASKALEDLVGTGNVRELTGQ